MTATVQDVMTATVIAVTKQADFKQIVCTLREHRVSACPVLDDSGQVIGVVSEADLLFKEADPELPTGQIRLRWRLAQECKATAVTAEQLMSSPAVTIYPGASVVDAARLMQDRQVKRLPVVGAGGQLIGIVSRADVLSVYERPDADILADVTNGVIAGQFALDPAEVSASVMAGVVTVSGPVERPETALELLARIRHVEGVVAVRNRLTVREGGGWSATG
ncbi:MAG: CBS domain-containing protein [Streptosporangiaceae bacterium]|jgi:CBS domain-containing protein